MKYVHMNYVHHFLGFMLTGYFIVMGSRFTWKNIANVISTPKKREGFCRNSVIWAHT